MVSLQLNFEQLFIVIFVIVNHMCSQLSDLLQILLARFIRKWDIVAAVCSANTSTIP